MKTKMFLPSDLMSSWTWVSWVFLLKNGRFTLNTENLGLEGETLLVMRGGDPTVIVPLRQKGIIDYRCSVKNYIS